MKSKYKIILTVLSLLLLLLMSISIVNYAITMQATQKQLRTQALPLSVDNIYTEIQKHIIHPYLVSSMMANDTFVLEWLKQDEKSVEKIKNYLDTIKNKYGLLISFLVSDKTNNYYTNNGLMEKISKEKADNKWYFEFKDSDKKDEINIDTNAKVTNKLIMFINFKMFDKDFHYLGAAGVGVHISYIHDMLQIFQDKYKLNVFFLDKNANCIISLKTNKYHNMKNINDIPQLIKHKNNILSKNSTTIEYTKDGSAHILRTKYIKELNIHLLVDAKLDDFTHETKKTFYINMAISLFLTLLIAIILIKTLQIYNKKLEYLATYDELTQLLNRRSFNGKLTYLLDLHKRNNEPLSLAFMDIDNFKSINDTFGHRIGDKVLQELSAILKNNIRKTDISVRWGGEEFVILFVNTKEEVAMKLANQIRITFENSTKLETLLNKSATVSIGVTKLEKEDTPDSIVSRADKAMYHAKVSGKNKVTCFTEILTKE